jgi:hypothetical protein
MAVKHIITFKTGIMPAIQSGMIKHDPFKQIKFKTKTVNKGFLTNKEIEMITNCELDSDDLNRIREQYLFCCYTGLAYSDVKQLKREHIIKQKDDE